MKRKHKFTKILSLAMMLVLTLSLFSPIEASAATAKKPVITATQTVVSKGTTTQLKATYNKKTVTTSATWKSSNAKVATVSKKGVLTAKASGVTYVTVKYKGKTSNKVKITVTQTKLSKTSLKLAGGKTYKLTAKYNGKTVKPSYKSSNTKIATVDKNGKITAVAKGSATITASYKGSKASCNPNFSSYIRIFYRAVTSYNLMHIPCLA